MITNAYSLWSATYIGDSNSNVVATVASSDNNISEDSSVLDASGNSFSVG